MESELKEIDPVREAEIKKEKESMLKFYSHLIWVKTQKILFWFVLFAAIGAVGGIFGSKWYYTNQTEESINLEKFSHGDSNYQIVYLGPKKRFNSDHTLMIPKPIEKQKEETPVVELKPLKKGK